MSIADYHHLLTKSEIELLALPKRIRTTQLKTDQQLLATIKFAHLYLPGLSSKTKDHKTREYFQRLKTMGILGFEQMLETPLLHEVHGQYSKMIGLTMPDGRDYYWHVMTADKVINQTLNLFEHTQRRPISSLTGICMFGSGVDRAFDPSGDDYSVTEIGGLLPEIPANTISKIVINQKISLYEAYKIKHFTAFLNTFSKTCQSGFADAYLMTPADQYPLYLFPAYAEGKLSKQTLQYWTQESSHRSERLFKLFAKRINSSAVLLASPFSPVTNYFNQTISRGQLPCLIKSIEILANENRYWDLLLSEPENRPNTWRELRLISYVCAMLQAATDAENKGNQLITIDDISEKPMANAYAKSRRKLRRYGIELPRLMGLYGAPGLVTRNIKHNGYIYGHNQPSKAEFKAVFETYRRR